MKNTIRFIRVGVPVAVLIIFLISQQGNMRAPAALAQSGGGYDLTWNTIDGGGGTSSGGAYTLSGTIGQPDAGTAGGGTYTLNGGFWSGIVDLVKLFLPAIMR